MRQRQDMQVLELENRVRQLAAENRMLVEFKAHAEQNLQKVVLEKDQEVAQLRAELNMAKEKIRGSSEDTARYSSGGGGGGGGWVAPEEEDETLQFLGEQEVCTLLPSYFSQVWKCYLLRTSLYTAFAQIAGMSRRSIRARKALDQCSPHQSWTTRV